MRKIIGNPQNDQKSHVLFSATRDSPPPVFNSLCPLKKITLCKQRPVPPPCVTLRLVLLSALWYSPPCVILRLVLFSATRDSPPPVFNSLCPLKKFPCVSNVPCHLPVLLSALCYSPPCVILRLVLFSATQYSPPSARNSLCPL